jgi:hypothetical protein
MPSYSYNVSFTNLIDSTYCTSNSAETTTVYSNSAALGINSIVYTTSTLSTRYTGYRYLKYGGIVYDINPYSGKILRVSSQICPVKNLFIYRVTIPKDSISQVDWIDCEGIHPPIQYLHNTLTSIDIQAQENTVSASSTATITKVGDCSIYPDCNCTYYGVPTTSTTTLPPINFTLTPGCAGTGINGTGTITVNSFSGGNNIYQSVAIGNSYGEAFFATPIALSGASSYQFTNLTNNVYFIVLRDSAGNYIGKSTTVSCTNTTTTTSTSTTSTTTSTTSTTSTTTEAPNCDYNGGSAVVVYPATTTSTSTTIPPTTTSTSTTSTSTSTTSTSTSTSTTTLPPAVIYWRTLGGGGGGGELEIRDVSNTLLLSNTTANIAFSGSLTVTAGQLPISVKGSWTAGSGNIVRYRICDGNPGSEIYASPDIDVAMGSDTYVLSPTPLLMYVHLTSGPTKHPVNCDGSSWVATTTTTTTTTAAPTCNHVLVNVGSPDRAASDDGKVYFYFTDCSGDPHTISYNTNKSHFDTGYCLDTSYPYGCYYLYDGGAQHECTASSLELGSECV